MREILFRGERIYGGDWAYGSLIITDKYSCILEAEDKVHPMDYPYLDNDLGTIDGKATPIISETIGQFTGLFDKNGKKIFEGDIVALRMGRNYEVKYNNGGFELVGTNLPIRHIDKFEVIGNIHDDPELLEVK